MRWIPSVDGWVITRDRLDTKRLTDQNGLGYAEKWASVSPWPEGNRKYVRCMYVYNKVGLCCVIHHVMNPHFCQVAPMTWHLTNPSSLREVSTYNVTIISQCEISFLESSITR